MDADPSSTPAFRWALAGLTAATLYLCWPLWPALVLALWTAALARPLLVRFERALHGRRRAAAALSLLLFVIVALPLGLIALAVASEAVELTATITRALAQPAQAKSALAAVAAGTGEGSPLRLPRDLPAAIDLLQRYGAQGVSVARNLAGAAANWLVAIFIYFGGAFVFLLDGPAAWTWIERHAPLRPSHLARFNAAFQETGRGLLVGVGLTSATQGLVATIVYLSLGIPRWWVLGPITGLASMIPVVGSGLVWGPLMIGLFLSGHPIKGAILLVLGVGVIGIVDNVLHPLFSRLGALRLPTFFLFVSIFGAMAVVGPWGAILGPLVARLWMEALALRREAGGGPPAEPGPR
jgi:predicted PurR-regulated permease PerM